MSKPKVYLETSFIGYLTARLSGDLITAAHQKLTRQWWDEQRQNFALHVSGFVLGEIGAGDPTAVQERMSVLVGVSQLRLPPEAEHSPGRLSRSGPFPRRRRRCAPRRRRCGFRDGLSFDVELQAHRECGHARRICGRYSQGGVQTSGALHA